MPDLWGYLKTKNKADLALGAAIMGINGILIGLYLGSRAIMIAGAFLGAVLGGFVSTFGARIFFISILSGAALGGLTALGIGAPDMIMIGVGTGAAAGGFLGINLERLIKH
jgi:hypothetical protein